ncbi:MAG: hypothetical protein KAX93_04480 [Flavobacterium sp.]|nr:hypothetical protein [Flavobacterium sp.]
MLLFTTTIFSQGQQEKNPSDFLPKGYVVFEKINGDLNNDGLEDCVLIIKATKKDKIIKSKSDELIDQNRRGIVVLFNRKDYYDLALKNTNCFSSENEEGGIYFAPELSIIIKENKLYVHYGHGRYGYWEYTFRFQNSDFELIGYDHSNGGTVIHNKTSINFLTGKKLEKTNTYNNAEGGDEVFKEVWTNINFPKLLQLSSIKDFDKIHFSEL